MLESHNFVVGSFESMGIGTDKGLSMKDTWIQVDIAEKAFDLGLNF